MCLDVSKCYEGQMCVLKNVHLTLLLECPDLILSLILSYLMVVGTGLVPDGRLAIVWTYGGLVYWANMRHSTSVR